MYNLAKGLLNISLENMFSGTRLYVAFVSSQAVAGDFTENPYNFQHFNITEIALYTDGNPVGNSPIKLNSNDVNGSIIVSAYVNFLITLHNGYSMGAMQFQDSSLLKVVMLYSALIWSPHLNRGDISHYLNREMFV